MSSSGILTVLIPGEGESWSAFMRRVSEQKGEVLLVISGRDEELESKKDVREQFLKECAPLRERLRIATKQPKIAAAARAKGIRVLDRTRHVKLLLKNHDKLNEALRVFSPHLWRQQLKSRLQRMGLLSIPRLRISLLMGLSLALFFFVVFRLLPSAEIEIRPREEQVSQTVNLLLIQSGATVENAHRVRTMPLQSITMSLRRSFTSTSISKEFIGTSAQVEMTIVNHSGETYSLRKGTRLTNQAGMVFKLLDPVVDIAPGSTVDVRARAEDMDLYGQLIGERGNVPAGLKWEIPGLAPEERRLIYGENRKPGTGGSSAYRTVLRQEDVDLALRRLEQEMTAAAKALVEEQVETRNATDAAHRIAILEYPELTRITFSGTVLPVADLGKEVPSFTVEESLAYTALVYDLDAILKMLSAELESHVREGKHLVADSLSREHVDVRVIGYDDNLSWVKLTVELVGTDRYILDPLSPLGALFGKRVREKVVGLPKDEALRIIKNMPEVDAASISVWPPWQRVLPHLPANITISPE